MTTHTIVVRVTADGEFTDDDLMEAVQATLHEVYPTDDVPVVPTVELA